MYGHAVCFLVSILSSLIVAIVGNNGVGKSTFLKLLIGELEPVRILITNTIQYYTIQHSTAQCLLLERFSIIECRNSFGITLVLLYYGL